MNLSNASNATIAAGQGIGTIVDDDAPPGISIGDGAVVEGDAGTVDASLTVSLSNPSSFQVGVDWQTNAGSGATATPGVDFLVANGSIVFAPGEWNASGGRLGVRGLGDRAGRVLLPSAPRTRPTPRSATIWAWSPSSTTTRRRSRSTSWSTARASARTSRLFRAPWRTATTTASARARTRPGRWLPGTALRGTCLP